MHASTFRLLPLVSLFCLLFVWSPPAFAAENMIGRQSQNEGILVVPAPEEVAIDGSLEEWDFSGRIWIFADQQVRNRYSAEVAAMWDTEALYIGAKWRDPSPMHSTVDPEFNPGSGWKSDSIQMRVRTEDQVSWLTTWYFTPRKQPVFHKAIWKDMRNSRGGTEEQLYMADPGGTTLGEGIEMAYRMDEDGNGYVQEIRIPWTHIYKEAPAIGPGKDFRLGFEFLWGDPTGQTWPAHRYADNMQPGATSREFFWSAWKSWGNATLLPEGNVEPRRYVSGVARIEGTIPMRAELPKDAARFTLVVEAADGTRIRNLAGDLLPEDYQVEDKGETRVVEVKWDGLDDKGVMVEPGSYQVRGLYHDGLGAEYEMTFYNPGTPPWETGDGSGAWGADHAQPLRVARSGEWMIHSWAFAEGGSGIIGIGPDGLKKWGEKRGALLLTADETYAYGTPAGWHIKQDVLLRLEAQTGEYAPFVLDGVERPLELPVKTILGEEGWRPSGLATTSDQLLMLLNPIDPEVEEAKAQASTAVERNLITEDGTLKKKQSRLAFLDKASGSMVRSIMLPVMEAIAARDNTIYLHDGTTVYKLQGDTPEPLKLAGLQVPGPMTIDNEGRLLVMDKGPDQQVKAFADDGTVAYTCGKQGGRPLRGEFEIQGLREVSSIAVDTAGLVWVVENTSYPRRTAVFDPADGRLSRHYVGTTGYAGTGCYLHDTNPELAYVGPIEVKLNKEARSWEVSQVLWVPDTSAGESFAINAGDHAHAQRFTATVNGQEHEYLFNPGYRHYQGYTIYMETAKGWQPVSAITTVGTICNAIDGRGRKTAELWPDFADYHPMDAVFWNDENGDGKVQHSECVVIEPDEPRGKRQQNNVPVPMGSGWGQRISTDFVFYVNGLAKYEPLRFTDAGAPVYGPESLTKLDIDDRGDLIPVPQEDLLLCLSWKGYAGPTGLYGYEPAPGKTRWSYPNPYPGVHGSHRATMPAPGLLIGPLKITGVAEVNDSVGRVFMMRGNLGQDFFMTTDGLFVGAMFADGRLPDEALPPTESELIGRPMESFSNGGEPFNGWFGKQADGVVRLTNGFPRQAAMVLNVKGLESIERFDLGTVDVTSEVLAQADADNQARAAAAAPAREYTVQAFDQPLNVNGSSRGWEGVPEIDISRSGYPFKGSARIGYDDTNLYLLYTVADDSPWKNEGKDVTRLFKTGDAVDLQLGTNPDANPKRRDPAKGDLRILISQVEGKPVAVLMQPVAPDAPESAAITYTSPVAPKHFDSVQVIESATVKVSTGDNTYTVEAAIPLEALGWQPTPGTKLGMDVGFISSDKAGTVNSARTYWSNKDTNLVNDLPQEAWFNPSTWGTLIIP